MYFNNNRIRQQLDNNQLLQIAPSIGAINKSDKTSDKYKIIPTIEIIELLRGKNWFPVSAEEVRVTNKDNQGFQKHMIRFTNADLVFGDYDRMIDLILLNSFDGRCAYRIILGVFEKICSNGLMVGNKFDDIYIKHIGFEPDNVINASYKIIDSAPTIGSDIEDMRKIDLSPDERDLLAMASLEVVEPIDEEKNEEHTINHKSLLQPRHYQHVGKNDLWTTFNTIQENALKGGVKREGKKKTREVKNIDKKVGLNKALWILADKYKEYKMQ